MAQTSTPVWTLFAELLAIGTESKAIEQSVELGISLREARSSFRRVPDFDSDRTVSWANVTRREVDHMIACASGSEALADVSEELDNIFAASQVLVTLCFSDRSHGE